MDGGATELFKGSSTRDVQRYTVSSKSSPASFWPGADTSHVQISVDMLLGPAVLGTTAHARASQQDTASGAQAQANKHASSVLGQVTADTVLGVSKMAPASHTAHSSSIAAAHSRNVNRDNSGLVGQGNAAADAALVYRQDAALQRTPRLDLNDHHSVAPPLASMRLDDVTGGARDGSGSHPELIDMLINMYAVSEQGRHEQHAYVGGGMAAHEGTSRSINDVIMSSRELLGTPRMQPPPGILAARIATQALREHAFTGANTATAARLHGGGASGAAAAAIQGCTPLSQGTRAAVGRAPDHATPARPAPVLSAAIHSVEQVLGSITRE